MINHVQQFPQLFGGVKSLQSGVISGSTAGDTYTVTISSVDPDNCIAFFYGGSGYDDNHTCISAKTGSYHSYDYGANVSDATTLTLRSKGVVTSRALKGSWFVIEFQNKPELAALKKGRIKSIQTGLINGAAKTGSDGNAHYYDVTISSVNEGNCLVLLTGYGSIDTSYGYIRGDSRNASHAMVLYPELTSSTNLRLHTYGYALLASYIFARWTIIEFDL